MRAPLSAGYNHRFGLHVVIQCLGTVLLAQTALLDAAEWKLVENDLRRIDPGVAGLDLLCSRVGLVKIACPYRGSETIDRAVGFFDRLVEILYSHYRQRRAKNSTRRSKKPTARSM